MGKYVLRDYQEQASHLGFNALIKSNKNTMIAAPTASGKSLIISDICHKLNDRTLILQPTKEILEQNYQKLLSYEIEDIGIYSASMKRKDIGQYTYATIQSIYKYPELFQDFKYVIMDECHLHNPQRKKGMYNSFFKGIGNPNVLGLSATPYRMVTNTYINGDGIRINETRLQVLNRIYPFFFKEFCYKIENQKLFKEGYLASIEYIIPSEEIDIRNVALNTTGSDFDPIMLERYLNTTERIEKLVEAIVENDYRFKNNLIFCSSIKHSYNVAEFLSKLGYDCEVITGEHSDKERTDILNRFKEGKITRLINVGVLTTGYDFPGLYGVTLGAPILSLGLYYQEVGRAIRLDPNNPEKEALVLDPFRLHKKFGRVETISLTKDGYKDQVETEVGVLSGYPLYIFRHENNGT